MEEIIRDAQPEDVSRIVEMGRRFLMDGPYKDKLADNSNAAAAYAAGILANQNGHILVAEKDGSLIGVIAFVVDHHPMSGESIAAERIWYVEPEHRPGGIAMHLMWEAEKLAIYLWENYIEPYDHEQIFFIGIGNAFHGVVKLLTEKGLYLNHQLSVALTGFLQKTYTSA